MIVVEQKEKIGKFWIILTQSSLEQVEPIQAVLPKWLPVPTFPHALLRGELSFEVLGPKRRDSPPP